MGRANTCVSGDEGTETNERMRLHAKKPEPRFYIIKNKVVLTVLTRMVFLALTLFSAGVITTSIWLMMDCRESFATVRPILPRNAQFCTNMGMPALFACCTMLFAIFGLGCTGRRLTGYALVIISSVEILQSVTALTFYKCNSMSRQDVMTSVNSSLFSCHTPGKSTSLFVSRLRNNAAHEFSSIINLPRQRSADNNELLQEALSSDAHGGFQNLDENMIPPSSDHKTKHTRHTIVNNLNRQSDIHNGRLPTQLSSDQKTKDMIVNNLKRQSSIHNGSQPTQLSSAILKSKDVKPLSQKAEGRFQHSVECAPNSRYFRNLSQRLKDKEVNACMQVCHAYKAVCAVNNGQPHSQVSVASTSAGLFAESQTADQEGRSGAVEGSTLRKLPDTTWSFQRNKDSFEHMAEECGFKVFKYVGELCYYDNKIILPLSLCAPLLCIALSMCFIYLAYCDRILKDEPHSHIFIQGPPSAPQKSRMLTFLENVRSKKHCFRTNLQLCHVSKDWPTWKTFVCCPSCRHFSAEYSHSTQELLNLGAIASSQTLDKGLSSPAASQYALNAAVSDDTALLLSGRSYESVDG